MTTRRWRRLAALAGALTLLGSAGACTAPPPGQDLHVSVGGGGGWGPGGPAYVGWAAVGPEPVTGPTTITLTVVSGSMVLQPGILYTDVDRDYWSVDTALSPDKRTLTVRFDGTTAPGRSRFFKFYYANIDQGALRVTIANANDTNPANDTFETAYQFSGPFVTTTTTVAGG